MQLFLVYMKDKVACGSFLPNYGKRKSVNEHLAEYNVGLASCRTYVIYGNPLCNMFFAKFHDFAMS